MPEPPVLPLESTTPPARDLAWLSRVIARRTTDLLCAIIVAGGLFTAAFQLWPMLSLEETADISPAVAPAQLDAAVEAALQSNLRWWTVTGDESAAWRVLQDELQRLVARPSPVQSIEEHRLDAEDLTKWPAIAEDPQGKWSVLRPPEWPRMAVAVSLRTGDPLICGWGMLRENAEGDWSVSIVRGPFKKSPLTRK